MSYESQKEAEKLKAAFRELFPLADERDLPSAPCNIRGFLADRLTHEVQQSVAHFQSRVVRVLCEVAPPKHVEDMARIAVDAAKEGKRLKQTHDEQRAALREIAALLFGQPDRATIREIVNAVKHRLRPTEEPGP